MAEVTPEEVLGAGPLMTTRAGRFVTLMGGVMSLALTAGICVWGYKIMMRDVSGVPVVQAIDGPMRVAPENPGGELGLHTGLSVNEVAAQGGAAAPEDRLVLAPSNLDVTSEDIEAQPIVHTNAVPQAVPQTESVEIQAVQVSYNGDEPLTEDQINALADQIAAASTGPAFTQVAAPSTPLVDPSVPGVNRSLRPQIRTRGQRAAIVPAAAPSLLVGGVLPITGELPTGTKLAQLGAFDTPELATSEWQRLSARFSEFMSGHGPVVQQAESGGRQFYRLRVSIFSDLADARRFCSALMAENQACIPVVVR